MPARHDHGFHGHWPKQDACRCEMCGTTFRLPPQNIMAGRVFFILQVLQRHGRCLFVIILCR